MTASSFITAALLFLAAFPDKVSGTCTPGRIPGQDTVSVRNLGGTNGPESATGRNRKGTDGLRSAAVRNQEGPDSTTVKVLEDRLQEYFAALEREPASVKCEEADFIIGTCTDSLVRQAVTILTYKHFLDSPVMGDDAVAIHIFDRWIEEGPVKMKNEADYWAAGFHARINRQSLIGCKAPEITLYSPSGTPVTVFGENLENRDRHYGILYFYDTDCARCKVESIMLTNMLENDGFDAVLYAVYTGKDSEKWERYRERDLKIGSSGIRTVHLWDPDMKSGMEMKYGIIRTPRLFLVAPSGKIIGRNLDTPALERLLTDALKVRETEYGNEESARMYRETFRAIEDTMGCEGVGRIAGYIERRTLERKDTALYRQMTGDLLYYLTNQRKENYKCGISGFADRFILSRPDIWNTADDSLKVIGLARFMTSLDALCPVGKGLPSLKIPATVKSGHNPVKEKKTQVELKRQKNSVILFHTEGCPVCRAEIAAADSLLECRGTIPGHVGSGKSDEGRIRKAVLVDMDEIWNIHPELAEKLMQGFDLSSLPFILVTDGKGKVSRKYISLLPPAPPAE